LSDSRRYRIKLKFCRSWRRENLNTVEFESVQLIVDSNVKVLFEVSNDVRFLRLRNSYQRISNIFFPNKAFAVELSIWTPLTSR